MKMNTLKQNLPVLFTTFCIINLFNPLVEAAPNVPSLSGGDNSGVQLNRTKEYLERQALARQIAEDRAKDHNNIDDEQDKGSAENQNNTIEFQLNEITTDASSILAKEDVDKAAADYLNKKIKIADLYKIVDNLNEIYAEKGYLTCRAYLAPQTISKGVVHIKLIEGKTGNVTVQGNDTTKESYIKNRLQINRDDIHNIKKLNDDLLRFNATNDVQLRIAMKAGTEPGTTDYVISAYEPKKNIINFYHDNAGSESSGIYRHGLFYTNRSANEIRDSFSITMMKSDGTKTFGTSYDVPIGHSGTRLNLGYSTNSVEITDGDLKPLGVKGHSNLWSLSITQPLRTTEEIRTEAGLEYNYQNSQTDFAGIHWLDDTSNTYTPFFSMTNYGKSSIFYQKHRYRFGSSKNIAGESKDFGEYRLNALYQKAYKHGQMLTGRFDMQWSSSNYLPSAEQFYIGGMYSVRGYKESVLSGDHGYTASLEYAVPIDKKKKTSLFTFFDYGAVYGETAFDDHILAGTGIGIKSTIADRFYTSVTLGVPLRRDLNGTEESKARVHFMFNGQF